VTATAGGDGVQATQAGTGLRVRGLTVEYVSGGQAMRPLEDLDLDARGGAAVLLRGPSGSGKTTLLSCLAAILSPAAGTIAFGDVEVTALSGRDRTSYRRGTVGVVFQAFNLVPSLTAVENVMAPMLAGGAGRRPARERAAALLEEVGLGGRLDHRPGQLSGGQQQRVAIARALVHDPPLLLADEPTAHLDHVQVEGVLALLSGLVGEDRVIVVSTHDDRLEPLGNQVLDLGRHQEERRR
jgi:putative ABC transport system ATP-binding protein